MASLGKLDGTMDRDPRLDSSAAVEPRPRTGSRIPPALGILALLASALFGGNAFGVREYFLGSESPTARPAAVSRGGAATADPRSTALVPKPTVLRSQPWWQGVTTLEGVGPTTAAAPFAIDPGAIQWRATPTCQTGRLLVRAPGQADPVLDAPCPAAEVGYGTGTGSVSLQVTADGPWQLQIEQQVDVPLVEPPLPGMAEPGAAVMTGEFYRVDQVGMGTATVYRLADSSYALRLDDFFVTSNTDLELQLSPLEAPQTTEEVRDARSGTIAALDVTAGSLNFVLPPDLDPSDFRSLVIWCERTLNAYAAATLGPA
jgi:hypothetical protein